MKNLNEYIRFEFNTNNSTYLASDTIIGTITIQALKDFSFDNFSVSLNKRIKGQLSTPNKRSYGNTYLENSDHWKVGKTYEYDVEIQVPEDAFSYSGENLEIIWSIEFELDPNDNTTSMLRKEFLTSIEFHSLFKSFSNFKHEYYINIQPIKEGYRIQPKQYTIDNNNQVFIALGVIILIIVTCLFKFTEDFFIFAMIIAGFGGYLLFKNIHHAISIGKLGDLKYVTKEIDDTNFSFNFLIDKQDRSIKNISYFYTIIEEVTDRRGTSDHTHTETIYESKHTLHKQSIKKTNELIIPYPNDINIPISLDITDTKIIWNISLKMEFTNGTMYTQKLPINFSKN